MSRTLLTTAVASLALCSTASAAAPLDAGAPVSGFGEQPAQAGLSQAVVGADGTTLVAATRAAGSGRQVLVAEGRAGQPPVRTELLGAAGDITVQPRVAISEDGHGAVVFGKGHTLYLSVCEEDSCGQPVAIGSSALYPEADVAVQRGGRTTVLFRGRSKSGVNRLQWRITTGGKLGPVHTLGEFGNTPRLDTDATGKTVALWTRYGTGAQGLRTAARRVGEFTAPATLQEGRVALPQLVTGDDGETIAAWVSSPSFDVQSPSAQARYAFRTPNTAFTAPVDIGGPATGSLSLARSADGHAVLALDEQVEGGSTVVQQSVRAPGGPFTAPVDLGAAAFVSTVSGVSAAIDDQNATTVAWRGAAGVFASRDGAAPQLLSADASALGQPVLLSAGGRLTSATWVTAAGPVTAQGR